MLRVEISRLKGLTVVVLFACALLATGFAHRVPVAGQAAVLAYVLAGGSAADLCADPAGKTPDLHAHQECPVCHLVGGAVLPGGAPSLRDAELTFVAAMVAPSESRALRTVRDPVRSLRAPPVV